MKKSRVLFHPEDMHRIIRSFDTKKRMYVEGGAI